MIPKECKRLAEVDFPIAIVSKHAAREKSIRYGHPSTLHLWWARRPLAACRAMLLALLLPDPCDEHCPPEFKDNARTLLPKVPGMGGIGSRDENLRAALLKFIGDFANWDLSSNQTYLEVSRALVKAAHDETPLVVDPFAGGGSIPLEALRLGCDAFASDLNPVACLILKTMLEDIPRHGAGLAEELRRIGKEIKSQAEKELAEFYPADADGAKPIAYLWARTVRCESPNCGAEIPLMRSFWLSKKAACRRALRSKIVRPIGVPPRVDLEIFEPGTEGEVASGTVSQAKAICLCCRIPLPPDRVRAQLLEQRGGAEVIFDKQGNRIGGAKLMAVVINQVGDRGRSYRLPLDNDYVVVNKAAQKLAAIAASTPLGKLSPVPDEPINSTRPSPNARGLSAVTRYGMENFGDLFTKRQKLAMLTLCRQISLLDSSDEAAKRIAGLAASRFTDISNALCRWENTKTQVRNLFTRQAISMRWDFAEPCLFGDHAGDYTVTLGTMSRVIDTLSSQPNIGQVELASACHSPLPDAVSDVWFTDPPYYDAIPYADLSDFFFVWLKRIFPNSVLLKDPFDSNNGLTPKQQECVWNQSYFVDGKRKDGAFFEKTIAQAAAEGVRVLHPDGIGCVVFAHKSTDGWEALLSGLLSSGWVIKASWPIATELSNRTNAKDAAALMGSVHLICRPRTDNNVGDWGEVLRELPKRVGDWIEQLQAEGVRGADLVFACIGPALEIFSRYARVETAEGDEVTLARYLEKVWEVVGRSALEHVLGTAEAKARNGAAGALEEDSRLTALFLWTMQGTSADSASNGNAEDTDERDDETDDDEEESSGKKAKGFSLPFDVVRRFAQPLGIRLPEWEGRIIETKKGVVRLLPAGERAKQLFGEAGAQSIADRIEAEPFIARTDWLPGLEPAAQPPEVKGRKRRKTVAASAAEVSDEALQKHRGATTLDRVHAAMLLQSSGRANALRALLKAEVERGPDFVRLANALTALYPTGSEEKRLLDAMLLAVPK